MCRFLKVILPVFLITLITLGAGIMPGTFNEYSNAPHVSTVLADEDARQYITILGLRWDGMSISKVAWRYVPGLRVWRYTP